MQVLISDRESYREMVELCRSLYPLEVKKSTIEGAGWGAFATTDIKEYEIIDIYDGTLSKDKKGYSHYCYQFADDVVVEPFMDTTLTAYINDTIDIKKSKECGKVVYNDLYKHNVEFDEMIHDEEDAFDDTSLNTHKCIHKCIHCCFIVATRDIYKGEELFINYSPSYWENLLNIKG